jgi:integrase
MAKVTIEKDRGKLRLRWQFQGERYALSLGLDANDIGLGVARMKAGQIQADMAAGHFDPTLLRYKPRLLGRNHTEVNCPELFSRFTQAMQREKGLSAGSLRRYTCLQSHINKCLNVPALAISERAAGDFAAYLTEHVSATTAKTYLYSLAACWDWARGKYHLAEGNPWPDQVKRIKPQVRQKVKPFTAAEVKAILTGFQTDRHYRHYYPLVAFMFGVGCRFGEAAGLKWKHLSPDFTTVWIGESVTREGRRKGTKTGKVRTVILGAGVTALLRERHQERSPKPEDLVFPAPKGGPLNDRLFNRRAWRTVLERVNIPYRKPYGMRHTAISHALAAGAHHLQVASQTGHDPRVLYQSYASVIESKSVFVEF